MLHAHATLYPDAPNFECGENIADTTKIQHRNRLVFQLMKVELF